MASSRLRKAFRYPAEDEDANLEMDEEQQEKLIEDLQRQDQDKTILYKTAFLAIPLLAAAYYLFIFISISTNARQRLLSLLSVSSLLATAYILHFIPLDKPDKKGKKPVYLAEAQRSPIDANLFYLNAALVGILLLSAALSWSRGAVENGWREALPAIIFALTMLVRQQLKPIDLDELHQARYELKGA